MTAVASGRPRLPGQPSKRASVRWDSLDVLRGLALCFMVAHHFHQWTAGDARERFPGFPGMAVTDLAAPAFAVGVGAAAYLVGLQVRDRGPVDWGRGRRALRRWGEVMALGLAIDVAVGGGIDGGGVLPSLAVIGVATTALAAAGWRQAWLWWALAAVCAVGAVPATAGHPSGFLEELWAGPFSIVVYGTFASAGAALAATARGGGEERLPLALASLGVLAAGTAAWLVAGDAVAPDGLWPPDRSPGGLAFTMWGLVGTLVLWMVVRWLTGHDSVVSRGLARAGQRTLLIFGTHYLVKLVLQWSGHLEELSTPGWRAATWIAVAIACLLAMAPSANPRGGPVRLSAFSARERVGGDSFVT